MFLLFCKTAHQCLCIKMFVKKSEAIKMIYRNRKIITEFWSQNLKNAPEFVNAFHCYCLTCSNNCVSHSKLRKAVSADSGAAYNVHHTHNCNDVQAFLQLLLVFHLTRCRAWRWKRVLFCCQHSPELYDNELCRPWTQPKHEKLFVKNNISAVKAKHFTSLEHNRDANQAVKPSCELKESWRMFIHHR